MHLKIKSLAALAGVALVFSAMPADAAPPPPPPPHGGPVDAGPPPPPRGHAPRHRYRTVCKKKWVHGHRQRVCRRVRR